MLEQQTVQHAVLVVEPLFNHFSALKTEIQLGSKEVCFLDIFKLSKIKYFEVE